MGYGETLYRGEIAGDFPRATDHVALATAELANTALANLFGLSEETSWQERALCAQADPEAFFPEKGGSVREAKRICADCEVRSECLAYALEHDERFGVWGGLSEQERRRLKRHAR